MIHILVFFLLVSSVGYCQIRLPELSPQAQIIENVGYIEITVRYGRPAARGRKIMGELVPYGRLWRTGAGLTVDFVAHRMLTRLLFQCACPVRYQHGVALTISAFQRDLKLFVGTQ